MSILKKIRSYFSDVLFGKSKIERKEYGQYKYNEGFKDGRSFERNVLRKKAKALRNQLPIETKKEILIRDGYKCFFCNKSIWFDDATIDHVIPVSAGGSNDVKNLVASCKTCNERKGNSTV